MTEQELIARFESCTLAAADFSHREHVRLAWALLRAEPLLGALTRFRDGLQRFAESLGKSGLYHETITWAYLLLIHERMQRNDTADFATFAAANADLLTWKPSVLDRYYTPETLGSELARRVFLMPDRMS
jgi:hypothetical protein